MPGGGRNAAQQDDDEYFRRYIAAERKKQAEKRKGAMTYPNSNMPKGQRPVGLGRADARHNIS